MVFRKAKPIVTLIAGSLFVYCIAGAQPCQAATLVKDSTAVPEQGATSFQKANQAAVADQQIQEQPAQDADEFLPPVRPGDDEKDPAVWQKYYLDYLDYIAKLTDLTQKQRAWEVLGEDLLQLSREHPDRISAHTMATVMQGMTEELKTKWRNQDDAEYTIDFTGAQADILDAALNFVTSDAFTQLADGSQNAVIWRFCSFAVELSWRSAFNATNQDLYPKIAEVFKTVLTNGSADTKAHAFVYLLHVFRTDVWGSPEGNKDVAYQILQDALDISGGVKGLMQEFEENVANSELSADARGHITMGLADMVWHQKHINDAVGSTQITDEDVISCTEKYTDFLAGINDGSIEVSGGMRDALMHHIGSAFHTLIATDKKDAAFTTAVAYTFVDFAQNNLLLGTEDGGSVGLQTTVINILTSLKKISDTKDYSALTGLLNTVLLNEDFDVNAYITEAREAIKQNGRADYEAWVSRAMAHITTLQLQENTAKVSDDTIKGVISDVKGWITDNKNLLDMRTMHWQQLFYDALAELVRELSNTKTDILADQQVADDLVTMFQTILGLKDSLVKELATTAVNNAAAQLREKGLDELASRLEAIFCADSQALISKMWQYYNDADYAAAQAFAEETIARYSVQAAEQQASLDDFAPQETAANYWALNDVATAHFILGKIYAIQGDNAKAREQFNKVISDYGFAQCWDPQGWYWKVAEGAQEGLDSLK